MPNRNYVAGVRLERKCMEALESMAYSVFRSAGSHGPADVIGLRHDSVILVQVKRGYLSAAALQKACDELLTVRAPKGTKREVWQWPSRGSGWVRHEIRGARSDC